MSIFNYIADIFHEELDSVKTCHVLGKVLQVSGDVIKVTVPYLRVGERCILRNPHDSLNLEAEVIGFIDDAALLSPIGSTEGISSETEVIATGKTQTVPVGPGLIGRVLNGLGEPIDGKGPVYGDEYYPVYGEAPAAMRREIIKEVLPLGVKALDAFLTMGKGQRMGVFAAAGVGKSKLLSSLVRGVKSNIVVLALIGERGREVREFIENDIGPEGMKKTVVICSTSDRSSVERAKAAYMATSVAEYFRAQGQDVLLLMDSVTRFARALREIGLSAGEPPARRGFPPSVFAMLPRLMERSGTSAKGSISAIYTVLVEGDDMTEPVADETRSILDGHIILSRKLAAANHYPAIDVLESVSRVMDSIVTPEHNQAARKVRVLIDKYREVDLLLKIGEYKPGGDPLIDEAVKKRPLIENLLKQGEKEVASDFQATIEKLKAIAS